MSETKITRREFISKLVASGLGLFGTGAILSALACGRQPPTTSLPASPTPYPTSTFIPAVTATAAPFNIPTSAPRPAAYPTPNTPATSVPAATPVPAPTRPVTLPQPAGAPYIAVARGSSPPAIVQAAIAALGGIERFVKPGNDVIIKPNICVAYHTFEYAATTNPEVVGTLVKLCRDAGAKRVRVMDSPFGGTAEEAYNRSGIANSVKAAGGEMELMARMKYRDTPFPQGLDIKSWQVYRDALETDVLINVPIAKHHNLSRLTLGMKNLMGLILNRPNMHMNLGQRLADLASLLRPALTVIDAVRILTNHGPTGGNLADVKMMNTIIASHDIVAADTYAAGLFGLTGADIPAIRAAAAMGLGIMDLSSIKIEEIILK